MTAHHQWIKISKSLSDDPRVLRMASRFCHGDLGQMSQARLTILGALTVFWSFADSHIGEDDHIDSTPDEINHVVGVAGFCDLLPADWFRIVDEKRVHLPNFLAHNGIEAKRRAVDQRRQQRHRAQRPKSVTAPSRQPRDQTKTKTKTKTEEKPLTPFDARSIHGLDQVAWSRWVDYRIKLGKPLKEVSLQAAAKAMAKHGSEQATAVEHTIANGWIGLRAPEQPKINHRGAHAPLDRSADWNRLDARAATLGHPPADRLRYTPETFKSHLDSVERALCAPSAINGKLHDRITSLAAQKRIA